MTIYQETNDFLVQCFHRLEAPLPSPVPTKLGSDVALRYNIHQLEIAIIQKLARYVSGLNASLLLLETGYTQELGALFRTLDEFHEDIVFLALPILGGIETTDTHKKYLENFFQEEFDNPDNAILSTQKRETIPRKKIRAVIANSVLNALNPHDSQELSRTISQAYSVIYMALRAISAKWLMANSLSIIFQVCQVHIDKTNSLTITGIMLIED